MNGGGVCHFRKRHGNPKARRRLRSENKAEGHLACPFGGKYLGQSRSKLKKTPQLFRRSLRHLSRFRSWSRGLLRLGLSIPIYTIEDNEVKSSFFSPLTTTQHRAQLGKANTFYLAMALGLGYSPIMFTGRLRRRLKME